MKYAVPAFLVVSLIPLTFHTKPVFSQADFIGERPSRLFKAGMPAGREICGSKL
jgi:hypothetical protein